MKWLTSLQEWERTHGCRHTGETPRHHEGRGWTDCSYRPRNTEDFQNPPEARRDEKESYPSTFREIMALLKPSLWTSVRDRISGFFKPSSLG